MDADRAACIGVSRKVIVAIAGMQPCPSTLKSLPRTRPYRLWRRSTDAAMQLAEESIVESKSKAISSILPPGRASSSGQQLKDVAFGVLISILQDIASRATPGIVDMLTGASATPASQVKFPLDGKKMNQTGRSRQKRRGDFASPPPGSLALTIRFSESSRS